MSCFAQPRVISSRPACRSVLQPAKRPMLTGCQVRLNKMRSRLVVCSAAEGEEVCYEASRGAFTKWSCITLRSTPALQKSYSLVYTARKPPAQPWSSTVSWPLVSWDLVTCPRLVHDADAQPSGRPSSKRLAVHLMHAIIPHGS
jgi:hypothetical protein